MKINAALKNQFNNLRCYLLKYSVEFRLNEEIIIYKSDISNKESNLG